MPRAHAITGRGDALAPAGATTTPLTAIRSPFTPVDRYRMRQATAPAGTRPVIGSRRSSVPGAPAGSGLGGV